MYKDFEIVVAKVEENEDEAMVLLLPNGRYVILTYLQDGRNEYFSDETLGVPIEITGKTSLDQKEWTGLILVKTEDTLDDLKKEIKKLQKEVEDLKTKPAPIPPLFPDPWERKPPYRPEPYRPYDPSPWRRPYSDPHTVID